jgi:hypothetical protein
VICKSKPNPNPNLGKLFLLRIAAVLPQGMTVVIIKGRGVYIERQGKVRIRYFLGEANGGIPSRVAIV